MTCSSRRSRYFYGRHPLHISETCQSPPCVVIALIRLYHRLHHRHGVRGSGGVLVPVPCRSWRAHCSSSVPSVLLSPRVFWWMIASGVFPAVVCKFQGQKIRRVQFRRDWLLGTNAPWLQPCILPCCTLRADFGSQVSCVVTFLYLVFYY